jgi:hypothetical protein
MVENARLAAVNSMPHAAYHQPNADLAFEIADLPAQRRLRGSRFSAASVRLPFGDRDKITKVL